MQRVLTATIARVGGRAASRFEPRGAALRALKAAGRRYRIVATAPTYALQHAAVQAGLAVMVSPLPGLPEGLRAVRPEEGLPELPETWCVLLKARQPRQPMTNMLAEHLIDAFRNIANEPPSH